MTIADIARAVAIAVEGKKDGLYQKKGADWVIRFTIQAQELCDRLRDAPLGTRFQIALVQLNDDETPKEVMPNKPECGQHKTPPDPAHATPGRAKSWQEMSPAQQAGLLCNDDAFCRFMSRGHRTLLVPESVSVEVRRYCGVKSRSEIDPREESGRRWRELVSDYRAWMREPEVV